jgi:uncharacterized protein YjbI with pentapeptide repeats
VSYGESRRRHSPILVIGAATALLVTVGLMFFVGASRSVKSRSTVMGPMAVPPRPMAPTAVKPIAPAIPPLPPLPVWRRHLPADLGPALAGSEELDFRGKVLWGGDRPALRPGAKMVFAGADLLQGRFGQEDVRGFDFRGADLSQADFGGAELAGARFDGANLHQTSFVGSDTLSVAGKTRVRDGITEPVPAPPMPARGGGRATWRGARLTQVGMEGMDLAGADFREAAFSQCRLTRADLRGANFREARFSSTNLEGAVLDGADLGGADLSGAMGLTAAQLRSARVDGATRLPWR